MRSEPCLLRKTSSYQRFLEERVPDLLRRWDADLRADDCRAPTEASSLSPAASSRLNSASARFPAALAAFLAVPPTALAAPTTCPLASLASWDSPRFAAARLRVA